MPESPRPSPNVEAIVSAYLRSRPEMIALVADRIYTAIPTGVTFPCIRVTLIDDEPVGANPITGFRSILRIECWGGSKAQAHDAAAMARSLLDLPAFTGNHAVGGTVSGVNPGTLRDEPDETFAPAKPRFLFTSAILNHAER